LVHLFYFPVVTVLGSHFHFCAAFRVALEPPGATRAEAGSSAECILHELDVCDLPALHSAIEVSSTVFPPSFIVFSETKVSSGIGAVLSLQEVAHALERDDLRSLDALQGGGPSDMVTMDVRVHQIFNWFTRHTRDCGWNLCAKRFRSVENNDAVVSNKKG
jgi:hypothetical protein